MINPRMPGGTWQRPQIRVLDTDPELPVKPGNPPPLIPMDPDQPDLPRYDDPPPPEFADEPPPTPLGC